MGARVYDPDTGTFLQTDPVKGGGANAYGYTDGDPVNELDLSGDSVVGDICVRAGNCTVHNGVPEPKEPTWHDVGQIGEFLGGAATVAVAAELLPELIAGTAEDADGSVASRIANGHAFSDHIDEFPFSSSDDFEDHISDVMENGDSRSLSSGRTAYYHDDSNTVVIHDPASEDQGTAFRPTGGRGYFDRLH
jgi:uncharacterized protein RhaS with RHS repeats